LRHQEAVVIKFLIKHCVISIIHQLQLKQARPTEDSQESKICFQNFYLTRKFVGFVFSILGPNRVSNQKVL